MRIITRIIYSILLLSTISSYSQSNIYTEGNKKFDNLQYMDAVKLYENVVKNGFHSLSLLQRIGNAYYLNGKYKTALIWYQKLFNYYPRNKIAPIYFFRYSHTLKSINKKEEAFIWLKRFFIKQGIPTVPDYLNIHFQKDKQQLRKLQLNSKYSDFSPFIYNSTFYFSSSRKKGNSSKDVDSWTNLPYYDIFKGDIVDNKIENIHKIKTHINTKYNETSAVLTKDGNEIYFTRNIAHKKEIQKFKLFKSTKVNGTWSKAVQLPFTKDEYLYAHPAINHNETKLYFAANLEDSYGESDIYVVDILGNGTYSKPKNLGKKINTFARDTYPSLDEKDNLFFASDGIPGLGGLDIFKAVITRKDTLVYHLESPINSNYDDFGYITDKNTKITYISSNRDNEFDVDNIFCLETPEKKIPKVCSYKVQGYTTEVDSKKQLGNATVLLLDLNNKIIDETNSNENGFFKFNVTKCEKNYLVRAHKEGYIANEGLVLFKDEVNLQEITIYMDPYYQEVNSGNDLGKTMKLNPIYFELDKYDIRKDAKIELEKIAQAMLKAYPTLNIQIGAHTDSRATDHYNLVLSEKRAESTMQYLISRGISPSRISGKGYGETQLLNRCSNGVRCPEKDHQKNRRTEFIISN